MIRDSRERFSDRVAHYIKTRPGYPDEVMHCLRDEFGLTSESVIADIGSGTGLLSEMFLKNGNRVFGVEPNEAMRSAGESLLTHYPKFTSVAGSAEETLLVSRSVDFIAAAQAFHWFDANKAKKEFRRILKPNGWIVLVWNDRKTDANAFLRDYENFLVDFSVDYKQVDHKQFDDQKIERFFGQSNFGKRMFENYQLLDYAGLEGRVLSSSYMPMSDHPTYGKMIANLRELFQRHEQNGKVKVEYATNMYVGQITI